MGLEYQQAEVHNRRGGRRAPQEGLGVLGGGNKCNRSQPRGPTTSQGASNTAGPKKRELNYPTVISSGVPPPPPP